VAGAVLTRSTNRPRADIDVKGAGCLSSARSVAQGHVLAAGAVTFECKRSIGRVRATSGVVHERSRTDGRVAVGSGNDERISTQGRVAVSGGVSGKGIIANGCVGMSSVFLKRGGGP